MRKYFGNVDVIAVKTMEQPIMNQMKIKIATTLTRNNIVRPTINIRNELNLPFIHNFFFIFFFLFVLFFVFSKFFSIFFLFSQMKIQTLKYKIL